MSPPTDETPFLADNEHSGEEHHLVRVLPVNAHFKHPLKVIAAFTSFLSIAIFALLIATYVHVQTGPLRSTWGVGEAIRDLSIVLFVNFILATPTIFLSIPILLNLANHIAMFIVVFVFASQLFENGWPQPYSCQRSRGPPSYGMTPPDYNCMKARKAILIMQGVSGGVSFLIGLLLLTSLLLRVVALVRTRFWAKYTKGKGFAFPDWNPTGFTVQFTLSVLPNERRRNAAGAAAASEEEEARLIET